MKMILFFFGFVSIFLSLSWAAPGEQASPAPHVRPPSSEKYWITLNARKPDLLDLQPFGHAWVVWGKMSAADNTMRVEAGLGFYPGSTSLQESASVSGFVSQPAENGICKFESKRSGGKLPSESVSILVSKEVYESTRSYAKRFCEHSKWVLDAPPISVPDFKKAEGDCVTFMEAIARKAGILVPPRKAWEFPSDRVRQIKAMYGMNLISENARAIVTSGTRAAAETSKKPLRNTSVGTSRGRGNLDSTMVIHDFKKSVAAATSRVSSQRYQSSGRSQVSAKSDAVFSEPPDGESSKNAHSGANGTNESGSAADGERKLDWTETREVLEQIAAFERGAHLVLSVINMSPKDRRNLSGGISVVAGAASLATMAAGTINPLALVGSVESVVGGLMKLFGPTRKTDDQVIIEMLERSHRETVEGLEFISRQIGDFQSYSMRNNVKVLNELFNIEFLLRNFSDNLNQKIDILLNDVFLGKQKGFESAVEGAFGAPRAAQAEADVPPWIRAGAWKLLGEVQNAGLVREWWLAYAELRELVPDGKAANSPFKMDNKHMKFWESKVESRDLSFRRDPGGDDFRTERAVRANIYHEIKRLFARRVATPTGLSSDNTSLYAAAWLASEYPSATVAKVREKDARFSGNIKFPELFAQVMESGNGVFQHERALQLRYSARLLNVFSPVVSKSGEFSKNLSPAESMFEETEQIVSNVDIYSRVCVAQNSLICGDLFLPVVDRLVNEYFKSCVLDRVEFSSAHSHRATSKIHDDFKSLCDILLASSHSVLELNWLCYRFFNAIEKKSRGNDDLISENRFNQILDAYASAYFSVSPDRLVQWLSDVDAIPQFLVDVGDVGIEATFVADSLEVQAREVGSHSVLNDANWRASANEKERSVLNVVRDGRYSFFGREVDPVRWSLRLAMPSTDSHKKIEYVYLDMPHPSLLEKGLMLLDTSCVQAIDAFSRYR